MLRDSGSFVQLYRSIFDSLPLFLVTSPGRINLISEHTDYCGGLVFPCALGYGTTLLGAPREDGRFNFASAQVAYRYDGDMPGGPIGKEWVNYLFGVIDGFKRRGVTVPGLNILISVDPQLTAGLSRSASICCAVALLVQEICRTTFDRVELARICQEAEHRWAGVKCGIMDQSAILLSKKGHMLRLNCATMAYDHIRVEGVSIIVAHSGVFRSLDAGIYNARVEECAWAKTAIEERTQRSYSNLVSVPFADLQVANLPNPLGARARHVITETRRSQLFERAMLGRHFRTAGILLKETHKSLSVDYDVSCPELDLLTDYLNSTEGVWGSRLTGGGCGGAAIALVTPERAEQICEQLRTDYYSELFDTQPVCFVTDLHDGAWITPVAT